MSVTKSEIIELIFRHKLKIVSIPILVGCLTVALLLFLPRTYRSEVRLFLQVGRESMAVDPVANTGGPTVGLIQSNRDEEVKSAIQVASSRGVVSKVVDELGPDFVLSGGVSEPKPSNPWLKPFKDTLSSAIKVLKDIDPIDDREQAIIAIEKNLSVEAERNSTVLAIALDSDSAEAAQKVLEKLIEVYKTEHLRIHRNPDSNEFLAEQTAMLHGQWLQAKDDLSRERTKSGILTTAGRRVSLETQMQAIELDALKNSQDLGNVKAKILEIDAQLSKTPERQMGSMKSVPNNGADLMREELYQNQLRYQDLKARLEEGHPLLATTTRQIEEAQKILSLQSEKREENNDDINPVFQELKAERARQQTLMAGLTASKTKLMEQKSDLQLAMENFNNFEIEIDRLEQAEQIARFKFTEYNSSLEQSRMSKALEESQISSISIVQAPTLSRKPISPSKLLLLLAGFVIAFASLIASIVLSEKLNDRIRSESDLENLIGLPVLTSIYENPSDKKLLLR
ncbi:MAG: Wzz/FepE/Etk N-terminal domain-containing protein [Planctomycetota bacterium]|nr:Wzz/FepE/Etk N-terminal domain-containing protein [Planctomycetota bacterium]